MNDQPTTQPDEPIPPREEEITKRLLRLRADVTILQEISQIADEEIKRALFEKWQRGDV